MHPSLTSPHGRLGIVSRSRFSFLATRWMPAYIPCLARIWSSLSDPRISQTDRHGGHGQRLFPYARSGRADPGNPKRLHFSGACTQLPQSLPACKRCRECRRGCDTLLPKCRYIISRFHTRRLLLMPTDNAQRQASSACSTTMGATNCCLEGKLICVSW